MDDDKGKTIDALEKELGLREKKDILDFRSYWSPRIFWFIFGILLFQALFVVAIGLGILDYADYTTVISVYLSESVVQIFGLGIIVLKFLFPNSSASTSLK